jgi:hypothetical protein
VTEDIAVTEDICGSADGFEFCWLLSPNIAISDMLPKFSLWSTTRKETITRIV